MAAMTQSTDSLHKEFDPTVASNTLMMFILDLWRSTWVRFGPEFLNMHRLASRTQWHTPAYGVGNRRVRKCPDGASWGGTVLRS